MADNLLDKASILLTPTAYRDGGMLSVKPNENLYGSELVTNGDFATDSDWNKLSNTTISGGKANFSNAGGVSLYQNVGVSSGLVKATFSVTDYTSGSLKIYVGGYSIGTSLISATSVGSYSAIIDTSGGNGNIIFGSSDNFTGSIDNVSIVEDLSGDFTFSRSSAATRVNAQGLVENVQIISSELVSNGNFSQIGTEEVSNGNFSQEGSELVTNGDFSNGLTNWYVDDGTSWTNVNNTAFCDGNNGLIAQNIVSTQNKVYKVTFDSVATNSSGKELGVRIDGGTYSWNLYPTGTHTIYLTAGSSNTEGILFYALNGWTGSIDNVSVKEVGQDWNLGTGWSIGEEKLVGANADSSTYQGIGIQVNKSYKIQFTVVDYVSGSVRPLLNGLTNVDGTNVSSNGTYTEYLNSNTSSNGNFSIRGVNFNGSITNISVKEVGQDWTLGTGWSVDQANSKATCDGTQTSTSILQIAQGISNIQNDLVKLSFEIKDYSAGAVSVTLQGTGGIEFNNLAANGVYEINVTSTDSLPKLLFNANSSFVGSITNISLKEITDDTDLPRINYEGFSYQDSLGSELVTNGDFSNGLTNWTTYGITSASNGVATIGANANSGIYQGVLSQNKSYKVTINVTSYNGVGQAQVVDDAGVILYTINAVGKHTFTFEHTITNLNLIIRGLSNSLFSIDNVSVKEYLGQEVVPDSGCGSWLLEPQSTNLITYSEDFSKWTKEATVTLTSNYGVSPDGTQNSTRVQMDSDDSVFISATSGSTFSVYIKGQQGETVRLANGGGLTHTLTGGWDRVSLYDTSNSSSLISINTYSSATSRDLEIWGAQLEQQSYATSYVPTSGATSTRLSDVANNSGNSTLINSTEGVLYAEMSALADDGTSRIISLSDGTDTNRINLFYFSQSNDLAVNYRVSGSTVVSFIANLTDVTNFSKVAFKWKSGDFKMYVDGTLIGTNANTTMLPSSTLDVLSFTRGDVSFNFFGKNKALAVYKEALTDANLRSLTYPNPVATTFDLDFDTIAEQFTFTRGSEATFVNAQGLIESTASNDAPRIDYSTGKKAFLLEPQSTNIITQSEDFSQWIDDTDTSITSNAIISPDGTQNADKLIAGNSVARQAIKFNLSASGNIVMSVFAKKGEYSVLQFSDAINGAYFVNFDIENGTIGASNTIVGSIQDYGNGWYRCVGVYNSANPILSFRISIAENSTDGRLINFSGNNSDGLYIYGAQLEQKSFSTSYIPTSGASATRNQELCNNATPVINSEEGTLYAEISALANDGTFRYISLINDASNFVQIYYKDSSNRISAIVKSSGSTQFFTNHNLSDATNFIKVAIKYKQNDFALWVDGVEVATDTNGNTPSGLSKLDFDFLGGNNFFGNTKGLKYYPKALADIQLEDLTTI